MNELQKQQVAQHAKALRDEQNLTQKDLRRLSSVSETNLSFMLSDEEVWREKVISEEMWVKLARGTGFPLSEMPAWVPVETRNYKRLWNMCDHARENLTMLAVSGRYGTGKSFVLKHYRGAHPKNTFYLECQTWTKNTFLRKLKEALGMYSTTNRSDESIDEIAEMLSRQQKPLVIIDEVSDLSEGAFKVLKALYNATEYKCGWVLCGGENFRKRMKSGVTLAKQCYQELYSRMGGDPAPVHTPERTEIVAICKANGIRDARQIDEVWSQCQTDLRVVERKIGIMRRRNLLEAVA